MVLIYKSLYFTVFGGALNRFRPDGEGYEILWRDRASYRAEATIIHNKVAKNCEVNY